MLQPADVLAARDRIAARIVCTPSLESPQLSALLGLTAFVKLECLQRTGSFKERGARNALLLLGGDERRRGVIAASAGNHALGLAFHGRDLGIPVTVVMPRFAPLIKVETCRRLGAAVFTAGDHIQEARVRADEIAAGQGLTYIHGYDDPAIIAGQGTIGLEILDQIPEFDAVIVPVGGAGLIAGIALVLKSLRPGVEVIGVEPERCPSLTAALAAGEPVAVEARPTLADGLGVLQTGRNAFELARRNVDRVATVSEEALARAIVALMQHEKCIIEGAGAAPVAACLEHKLPHLSGKRVVFILAGGNIDLTVLGRVIETGLVASHQLYRFQTLISDRPGGLARFASVVSETGASIEDITHDRAFGGADFSIVRVLCTVQTRDANHIGELRRALQQAGMEITAPSEAQP